VTAPSALIQFELVVGFDALYDNRHAEVGR
jgi:hypothetical protein